jgi:hypothetical protein
LISAAVAAPTVTQARSERRTRSDAYAAFKPDVVGNLASFEFDVGRQPTLRCNIDGPQGSEPWTAMCEGIVVGGNRAAVRAAAGRCAAVQRKTRWETVLGGPAVAARGRGALVCIGEDNAPGPVMPVGQSVTFGPFVCAGKSGGISCKAHSGHGFFFGRDTWSVW